jgi:predicted TIM-barrel fold metal-dependent hydrolase
MPKSPAENAAVIAGLGLGDAATDKVLRRNAARILGLPLPASSA